MTTKRSQITSALTQFYKKPIANISMELFFTLGTVILFALFSIKPTLLTMSDLIKELNDKRELNQKLKNKVISLGSAQNEFQELKSQLGVLDIALPSSPEFDKTVLIIEKLASDNKLPISSLIAAEIPAETLAVTPEAEELKTRITYPLSVTVVGDFPSIRKFLEDIRNVQRTIVVETVTFTTTESAGNNKLQATISLSVHYFGLDKTKDVKKEAPTP